MRAKEMSEMRRKAQSCYKYLKRNEKEVFRVTKAEGL